MKTQNNLSAKKIKIPKLVTIGSLYGIKFETLK